MVITPMRNVFCQVVFMCAFFLFAPSAYAATIYVNSIAGNDTTGTGSVGAPYATFHKGYTMASANDTLDLTGIFDISHK